MLVVISQGPLGGCGCFLEASGWLLLLPGGIRMRDVGHSENVHAKSAKMTPGNLASDLQMPGYNVAHSCCAKLCRSKFRLFLIPLPLPRTFGG